MVPFMVNCSYLCIIYTTTCKYITCTMRNTPPVSVIDVASMGNNRFVDQILFIFSSILQSTQLYSHLFYHVTLTTLFEFCWHKDQLNDFVFAIFIHNTVIIIITATIH